MKNVEMKIYNGNKWETIARIGSIVTIQKVDEPTMIDAGIVPGMEGVIMGFELVKVDGDEFVLVEVDISEKHISYYFRPEQLKVTRL